MLMARRGLCAVPATRYNGPMTRRRLPIGIQTFRTLRERDCYYVDKTAFEVADG